MVQTTSWCSSQTVPQLSSLSLHENLPVILGHIFPLLLKTAIIVPVPKNPSPKALNNYRPVVLTSVPFKCIERLILKATRLCQDPLKFAYRANRSTEDAILTLLHAIYKHLEKPRSYLRLYIFRFLQCVQYNLATLDESQAVEHGCEL